MADLKVIMVGGRRSGKSSILASMEQQLIFNSELGRHSTITSYRDPDHPQPDSLSNKYTNLQSFLDNPKENCYLVDFGATTDFSYYSFKIRIPDGKGGTCLGNIKVEFVDCPGESYSRVSDDSLYETIHREISSSHIFIIVVDTPYLMDTQSDYGKFHKVNLVPDIIQLFDEFVFNNFKGDDDYKKIIFAPVKCEAWRDNLDQVAAKLQEEKYYGTLFARIRHEKRLSCSIIPVLTAGGIVFQEFGKPMLLNGIECSPLGTKRVRMKDGTTPELQPGEQLIENKEHKQFFPFYSWFENVGEYNPENCDQIALHVLRFIVFKTLVERSHSVWPFWLTGFPSNANMINMISNLGKNNLLKDGDMNSQGADKGIVHIRKIETDSEINKYK